MSTQSGHCTDPNKAFVPASCWPAKALRRAASADSRRSNAESTARKPSAGQNVCKAPPSFLLRGCARTPAQSRLVTPAADGKTLRPSITQLCDCVTLPKIWMLESAIRYNQGRLARLPQPKCGLSDTLLANQILQFTQESLHILKIPVNGGKPDIGDLIQGEQPLGQMFSYF